MRKMKGEALEKPPPLLLPPSEHGPGGCAFGDKEKFLEERAVQKFTARYDAFQGILKRVTEMKLSGSLDSEEPSTGSEKSESSTSGQQKRRFRSGRSFDDRSVASTFEDESSASSIAGSDRCSPREEIPGVARGGLPSRSDRRRSGVSSFRGSPPPPPSPADPQETASARSSSEVSEGFPTPPRPRSEADDEISRTRERRFSEEGSGRPEGISEAERHQLETFFKSLKTDVYVCGSLANLYLGRKEEEGKWTFRHTGVVVVVFDSGDTRCRRKRKIQILLAERGTCFPLWKDTIDNLSSYRKSGSAFHTMHLSCDHRQMAGLSFDSASEADGLLAHLEELTSDPENINISAPGSGKKKKKKPPEKRAAPLPRKKDISNPCLFQHVTSVAAKDKPMYASMQTLIDGEIVRKTENIC